MNLRALTAQQIAAWLAGAALTTLLMWAARVHSTRAFNHMQSAMEAAERMHGDSASDAKSNADSLSGVRAFHLPVDSPEAVGIVRAMRRVETSNWLLLSASGGVLLALIALTGWWAWLKRGG